MESNATSTPTMPLENTVQSLQRIARKLESILPGMDPGPLRDDLVQMHSQCQIAIPYYASMTFRSQFSPMPDIVGKVSNAAFGVGAVGLVGPTQ